MYLCPCPRDSPVGRFEPELSRAECRSSGKRVGAAHGTCSGPRVRKRCASSPERPGPRRGAKILQRRLHGSDRLEVARTLRIVHPAQPSLGDRRDVKTRHDAPAIARDQAREGLRDRAIVGTGSQRRSLRCAPVGRGISTSIGARRHGPGLQWAMPARFLGEVS